MFSNLLKAVVAAAATPVTLAVDAVMIPFDSCEHNKNAFSRTSSMIDTVAKNINEALK